MLSLENIFEIAILFMRAKEQKTLKEEKVTVNRETRGEVKKEVRPKKAGFNLDVAEMAEAGLHFGHRVSRLHPKMKPYIYGVRNTVHLIDLEKAALKLKAALDFIERLIAEGKNLLLVGTKIQVKGLIKEMGEEFKLPYVQERWLGGTLTNFEEMRKRIDYFKELEKKKEGEELEKYTKKERMEIEEELGKLEKKFGGLRDMKKLPEAVFVCDMKQDKLACKEARRKGVKVIGIADTNIDPGLADFVIPANDDAISSLRYILGQVREAIKRGRRVHKEKKEKDEEAAAEEEEKKNEKD